MNNQGLLGALSQYWTVDPKPRLGRKNTFFDDVQLSNWDALKVGIAVSSISILVLAFWCLLGAIL
jgi:hypothetical protein